MKIKHHNFLNTAAVLGTLLLSACTSSSLAPPASAPQSGPMVPASPTPVAGPVVSAAPSVAHVDPNSTIFQSRSIYFDFDKSVIKAEFQKTLEVHGQYLAKNPTVVIKIEGNTDQKGSAKYNLTLGKRRADAVAKVLKLNGARAAQMGVISFGKVKPKVLGSDDSAMAQNRRVDLSYPAK